MNVKSKRLAMLVLGLVVVGSLVAFVVWGRSATWGRPTAGGPFRGAPAIGLISIEGVITGGSSGGGLLGSVLGSDSVLGELRAAREDPATRAVVLRINSPGGSAAASQEIAREVQRLREAGKVVVASMGDVAASGGYWIACSAQHIVANPATMTGSIGVIMELPNLMGLYGKLGISYETIKSGPHKDIGSPNRPLEAGERAILQGMVDDIFQQFIEQVSDGRAGKITRSQVVDLADGRVFTGRQALKLGLVDELGNLRDSVHRAAALAGIEDRYELKTYREVNPFLEMLRGLGLIARPVLPGGGFTAPPTASFVVPGSATSGAASPASVASGSTGPASVASGAASPADGSPILIVTPLDRLQWAWWAVRQVLTLPLGR